MCKFLKALFRPRPLLCMSGTEKKRDDGEKKTGIAAKEQEREREAHSKLLTEHNKMVKKWLREKKSLKASLAEAEGKHEQTMQTIAQLETENSSMLEKLREKLQDIENLKSETPRMCDRLFEVSLAEAKEKEQKALETIARLETENSNLTSQVEELRETVKDLGTLLTESYTESNKLINVSLVEAKEKSRKAVGTIAPLKSKSFVLTNQVEALRKPVQVSETHRECDK